MKRSEQRVYGQKMKLCKREGTTFLWRYIKVCNNKIIMCCAKCWNVGTT